jgi:hypothetical protein
MKILLLIPPVPASIVAPWFLREERHAAADNTPTPPYFAPAIMGMVRKQLPDATLKVIDAMAAGLRGPALLSAIDQFQPDLIVTILCANHLGDVDERLCAETRYPTISVITPVGVNVVEAITAFALKGKYFTASDEAEVAVATAAKEFRDTGKIEKTPGLIINSSGLCRSTGASPYSDMRTFPMPAFDLFPFADYNRLQDQATQLRPEYRRTALINGMKGCPYHCNFCIVGTEAAKARTKTGEQIFREVKYLYDEFGMIRVNFLDSEFGVNKRMAKEFCRLVVESGMTISFDIKNRIEFWDEDLLRLMKEAGCRVVFYGIETADPRLQKIINKNLDLDQARQAIAATRRAGIKVFIYMIVGIPCETPDSLRMNAQFIADTKPDGISWGILFPEVGSPLYEELKEKQLLVDKDWSNYRRLEGLTFKHETYGSMEEIKLASLWMRNLYRWALVKDSSLATGVRAAYLLRYLIGQINYVTWRISNSVPILKTAKHRVGIKIDRALARFAGKPLI